MNGVLWLLLGLPLVSGALLALTGSRGRRAAPGLAIAAAVATLGLARGGCRASGVSAPLLAGIDAAAAVDGLSAVLVLTVAATTLAVLVFAASEFGRQDARARFFGLMLLFAGAMLVTVTATTLPLLLMGWEAMGATSWALIGFWWRDPRRVRAATTAFVVTRGADLGLYLAAGAALAGGVGSLALAELPEARNPWLAVATAGVVLAALGKSAQLPFSFWLSRAMEGPSSVSALLHSAVMVAAGGYLLLRLEPLLVSSPPAGAVVAWTGVLSALLLGLVAVAQTDLKQLLAASTCSQLGFVVLAAGAGGAAGGTLQLVAHAATKSLLFLVAGAWLVALGTKSLPRLQGAARRHPVVGAAFTVGALTLAGLPPASIWVAKDEVLAAALARQPVLYAAGLAAAAVSAAYSARALWFVWRPPATDAEEGCDAERRGSRAIGGSMRPPLVVLAACAVALGALALVDGWRRALDADGEASPAAWQLAVSAGLALVAAGAAWVWGGRPLPAAVRPPLAGWLGLEQGARLVVVRPTLALARALAALDDRVLDRGVHGAAAAVRAGAAGAGRLDERALDGLVLGSAAAGRAMAAVANRSGEQLVDGAVVAVAAVTRRLGRLARRPQTGQLHQYYAQAVAALTLLAIVIALVR
ncbi:MAG: proton-conducting transporter membrane subunit [Thermoleophilia bacterium]